MSNDYNIGITNWRDCGYNLETRCWGSHDMWNVDTLTWLANAKLWMNLKLEVSGSSSSGNMLTKLLKSALVIHKKFSFRKLLSDILVIGMLEDASQLKFES